MQEERRRNGSVAATFGIGEGNDGSLRRSYATSGYQRKDITFSEFNYDLMLNYNYNISDKVNIAGVIGTNMRRTNFDWTVAATNGGTGVEGLYSVQNSANPVPFPKEISEKVGVNGIYGSFSLGYDHFLFLDATLRRDHSSTLPEESSSYYYPSIATSFVFTKFIPGDILSHGKFRASYARVGNGMIARRQGIPFFKKELKFQYTLFKFELINLLQFIKNLFTRALPRLLPAMLLNIFYNLYLRK